MGAPPGVQPWRRQGLRTALMVAGGLLLVLLGAGLMWVLHAPAPQPSLARLSLDVRPAEELNAGGTGILPSSLPTPGGSRTALTWTPDGQALVYVGRRGGVQQLYVRRLDGVEARPLAGTEGAQVPAVSPDGQWVAFWAQQAIRKVPLGEGPVMDLAPAITAPPRGLVWDARGRVFFADENDDRIWQIPPEGTPEGTPKPVTTVGEAELGHSFPWLLPGDRALLYTARKRDFTWGDEEIIALTLATGERKVLLRDAADARYVATGHLVFLRRGVLFAVGFDPERLEVRGKPVAVLAGVSQALTAFSDGNITGAGQFAIAATGTLAWIRSPVLPYEESALVTVDRRGQVSPLSAPVQSYYVVRVSPDGRRLGVSVGTLTDLGLWVYDLSRGTLRPLAGGGESLSFVWSPDGQRLVFDWLKDGRRSLASQRVDGTTPPEVLAGPARRYLLPSSWTPDGRQLALTTVEPGARPQIVIATVDNGRVAVPPLTRTPQGEQSPEFTPDGHWLAYVSNVSGHKEVYVQPFPGSGSVQPVSVLGGDSPAWHPNGRELFYMTLPDAAGKRRMMVVGVGTGSTPRLSAPRQLFEFDPRDLTIACSLVRCYDVAPDGQRFYGCQTRPSPVPPPVTQVNIITNWLEELKQKVPPAR